MNAKNRLISTLFFTLVGASLLTTACASPTTAPNPVVAKPTTAPAQPLTTASPALPEATATPEVAATTAPATPAVQTTLPVIPTTAASAYNIGTPQTIGGVSLLPTKIQFESQYGANMPKAGDQFAVVTFSIDNTSKTDSFSFDPANMVALDPQGTTVSMAALESATDELTAQKIDPGKKVEGVIVYDVPKDVSKWLLEYKGTNNNNLMWTLG